MKKLFVLFMLTFALVSCNNTKNNVGEIVNPIEKKAGKISVTASLVPLASIVNYIGGELVDAKSLVPAGVSPHGFDLKPNQVVNIEKSDLIVYLDLDHLDGFLNKAIEGKTNVISVKKGIELLESIGHDHDEHEDEEEHHDEHEDEEEGHSTDPHIWGNAENAYLIANTILKELVKLSPENKDYFNSNLESFKNELDEAKNKFEENTKNKTQGNFIAFHDAYNYLFAELNIDNNKKHIFRTNELSDPNSSELKNLIDEIGELKIKVVFREPQLNSDSLKKIASDNNLSIFVLDPLGFDESKEGYIKNYKSNLESLEKIYE